jgi:predicted RNase H-related nuclease YkuK (DUF458 family)
VNGLSIDDVLRLVQIVVIVVSVSINAWFFFQAKSDQRIKDIERRQEESERDLADEVASRVREIGGLSHKVGALEEWRKHVPNHDDIDGIKKDLATMGRQMATVDERSVTTLNGVRRIEQFLMERGNK